MVPLCPLAQWGTGGYDVGTYAHALNPNQLWRLKPHPTIKPCYYIVNEVHSQHRITDGNHVFIAYSGHHYNDQLFRFVPSSYDGYYYIYNCYHWNDRITKSGIGNRQVMMYSGPLYDDQLWRLVPRFTARFYTDELFHFDNRQGSNPIEKEISVTTGVKRSSTTTIRNKYTFRTSLKASLSAAFELFGISAEARADFSSELDTSFSKTSEVYWSKTEKMKFVIPPFKNYKVMQHVVPFNGQFSEDSCLLKTSFKIFESDTANFEDKDNFIIEH